MHLTVQNVLVFKKARSPCHHAFSVPFMVPGWTPLSPGLVPSASTYPHGYGREAPAQPVKDIESQEAGHRNEVAFWGRKDPLGDGDEVWRQT